MAKKRKGRSIRKNKQTQNEPEELTQAPHSFIIHRGLPGSHIVELTRDFRRVMEPFTAANLKERKKNTIKDFVSLSGIFHISHMGIFTRTEFGMYFKVGKMPRGPTLTFKVHSFSLARDVISTLKKQLVSVEAFKHSPLIVMNNFSGEGMHIKLMASTFQNMFPTINLQEVNLNTMRRVVLLSYNPTTKLIDFRHYSIKVIPVGVSKGVKKFIQGKVPDLSKCNDISDFLTKSALLSESEAEDDPNSQVTMPQKLAARGNIVGGQSAVRLSELGPRLTLQLMKVEDGLLDGEVLFHELIHKTEEERAFIQKKREQKRKLKEKRKTIQDMNIKKKEKQKEELKQKSLDGMKKKGSTENDRLMRKAAKESIQETEMQDDDDAEYYRQEVGQEPDKELFSSNRKRTLPYKKDFKNKKPRMDNNTPDNQNKYKKNKKPDSNNQFKKGMKSNNKFNKNSDGKKKWPGGRGGNPKYGLKAQSDKNHDDSPNKFNKKPGAPVRKVRGTKIVKRKR